MEDPRQVIEKLRELHTDATRAVLAGNVGSGWLAGGDEGSRNAAAANLTTLGEKIERWSTALKGAAEKGAHPDGRPYTWARWLQQGRELAGAVATHRGVAWEATPFAVAAATFEGSVETVKGAAKAVTSLELPRLPGWLPWAAGGVGVLAVGLVVWRVMK